MKTDISTIMATEFASVRGATRFGFNHRIIQESRDVSAQFGFLVYRGSKTHEGALTQGKYKGITRKVDIDAYGLIIFRVIEWDDEQKVYDYDMGYLSAKNNETYSVLNRLVRMDFTGLDELISFVRKESQPWEESFHMSARKALRNQLGIHNYNPFRGPSNKGHGKGLDI